MKLFINFSIALTLLIIVYWQFGAALPASGADYERLAGQVVSVVDGDSLKLQSDDEVLNFELAGIDAPEIGQYFGETSGAYLSELVSGRSVIFELHRTGRNGELHGELFLNGVSINKLMIRDGFAWAQRGKFSNRLWIGLESKARGARFGLWRREDSVPPWDFYALTVSQLGNGE